MFTVGIVLLVISQFTGMYYTFDAMNRYQRNTWYPICYVIPIAIILIQMSVVMKHRNLLRPLITKSLILYSVIPLVASVIQFFAYGLSLTNICLVGMVVLIYIFALIDLNDTVEETKAKEIEHYKDEQRRIHTLFEETAEALANAIDAKDKYTHGHSTRVAEYSKKIAEAAGKSPEECEQVYFAGLLHDVGKIGVPDQIINKDGKLTDEEFAYIKQHPVIGNDILKNIGESPYLSIGAHYHHERYDGHGYPEGLKGNDIPEMARIIGVADAYDAMTSKRSYRDPIPQQKVREELVKGMGTQFDPEFAKIMLHEIDLDTEYWMQERTDETPDTFSSRIRCGEFRDEYTEGLHITDHMTRISFNVRPDEGYEQSDCMPAIVLFDSLDARVHNSESKIKDLLYFEYAEICFDGNIASKGVRKIEITELPVSGDRAFRYDEKAARGRRYELTAAKTGDHVRISITGPENAFDVILALPDSSRFAYLSVTGQHSIISNIHAQQDTAPVSEGYIPRLAEEISYIKNEPVGDMPNIQVDGWREATSEGVAVDEEITLRFHSMSLPTSRLVWHCPFVSIYTSKNGWTGGEGYREFTLIRLDGENWESDRHAEHRMIIHRTAAFEGWNEWKDRNRAGIDCTVTAKREGNVITVTTENLGIAIKSITTIKDENVDNVYIALTGDQVAISNIRVERPVSF
ncbi:MAG: HD-GYP domain-containing protein [Mogibacterium sp.]|nr:HD-GYP domain-containing protein [Mogibacterium sp.]